MPYAHFLLLWTLFCPQLACPEPFCQMTADQRGVAGLAKLPQDLQDAPVDPFRVADGQPTVLLFVRTDCPISNRYAPSIQRLAQEFQGRARFWLVYPDNRESPARIREHRLEYRYSIPALRDVHHSLVNRAHAAITPEAAVFDASGQLRYHGRIDNWYQDAGRSHPEPTTHELADALRNVLDGKRVAAEHVDAVGCYIADLK